MSSRVRRPIGPPVQAPTTTTLRMRTRLHVSVADRDVIVALEPGTLLARRGLGVFRQGPTPASTTSGQARGIGGAVSKRNGGAVDAVPCPPAQAAPSGPPDHAVPGPERLPEDCDAMSALWGPPGFIRYRRRCPESLPGLPRTGEGSRRIRTCDSYGTPSSPSRSRDRRAAGRCCWPPQT